MQYRQLNEKELCVPQLRIRLFFRQEWIPVIDWRIECFFNSSGTQPTV